MKNCVSCTEGSRSKKAGEFPPRLRIRLPGTRIQDKYKSKNNTMTTITLTDREGNPRPFHLGEPCLLISKFDPDSGPHQLNIYYRGDKMVMIRMLLLCAEGDPMLKLLFHFVGQALIKLHGQTTGDSLLQSLLEALDQIIEEDQQQPQNYNDADSTGIPEWQ